MIIHLFNSSLVSGPETLVIPALPFVAKEMGEIEVANLSEIRTGAAAQAPLDFARSFGLSCFSVEVRSRMDGDAVKNLAAALEARQPRIVHAHDVKASAYLHFATLLLRLRRPEAVSWKLVSTHHGVHARSGAAVRAYEMVYGYGLLRGFDKVLCVCSSDRQILIRRGIAPDRIAVHLNGVDRQEIASAERKQLHEKIRDRWSRELGVELHGKTILGVAARLAKEKNHALLLDALASWRKVRPEAPWICLCFGGGPLEGELRKKTSLLGLGKDLHWAGYRSNLSAELAGFDLLLSLSTGEGLPINLLEAGWSGTPILATAVDGVADLLPDDDETLAFSRLPTTPGTKDVMERLALLSTDHDLADRLGRALQKRVKMEFSGTKWRERLVEIYRELK
jgi:glycosyltransferase involved in cell wall biosynthesis